MKIITSALALFTLLTVSILAQAPSDTEHSFRSKTSLGLKTWPTLVATIVADCRESPRITETATGRVPVSSWR